MKFIHLTDPHLVPRPRRLYDIDVHDRLAAAVKSINENHADAEFCMVTGDLADKGEQDAYLELRGILDELACPWHPLVGNHDSREVARAHLPDLPWHEDGFLQYSLKTSAGRFVALDSVDEGRGSGLICEKRLGWLRQQLEKTRSANEDVLLFMHHAPFEVGIHGLDRIRLMDADPFLDLLSEFDHIRHLFMGHLHRSLHGSWRGIPFSTVKATAHQISLIVDDYSPLTACRENPAYAVVLVSKNAVIIHDHSYLEEDSAFFMR